MDSRTKDLISTPWETPISVEDMIYVIKDYVKELKEVGVKISLPEEHPMRGSVPPQVFAAMIAVPYTKRVEEAFSYARAYFMKELGKEKNGSDEI
mgnify:CR=1 FL=1